MKHGLMLACALVAPALALASPTHEAVRQVGTAYHWGGRSPQTGFDCSGLVAHAFEEAWGLELPHSTQALRRAGQPVRFADLRPGDLVFYNTRGRPYSHVGIYLGDGRFVHAPRRGAKVRIESLETRYWRTRFNGARRLEPPSA
ncbi:MAG: C40 family peptidase [Betaproteobacteria bacterium]